MKRLLLIQLIFAIMMIANLALAESFWFNPSAISAFGDVQLAAATATKIPTTPTSGRAALSIQNLDAADIFCGGDSTVTNTHFGLRIAAGTQTTIYLSFNASNPPSGTTLGNIYCYSVGGMAATNLHYWELQ